MKKNEHNYFFDVHLHSFNLSHAGLLAFLNRFFFENTLTFNDLLNGNILQIGLQMLLNKKVKNGKWARILRIITTIFIIVVIVALLLICTNYIYYVIQKFICGNEMQFSIISKNTHMIISVLLAIIAFYAIYLLLKFIKSIVSKKGKISKEISNVVNVLSIFENDLGRQFRYLELDYISMIPEVRKKIKSLSQKEHKEDENPLEFYDEVIDVWEDKCKRFKIGEDKYDKVILTPLMMDFRYKGFERLDKDKVYYNLPPRKSIIDQTIDTFNGIKDYLKTSRIKILEIYPFLGINPVNYDIEPSETLSGRFDFTKHEKLRRHFYFIEHTNTLIHYRAFETNPEDINLRIKLESILENEPQELIKWNDSKIIKEDITSIKNLIKALKDNYEDDKRKNKEQRKVLNNFGLYKQNKLVKMLMKYFEDYNKPNLEKFKEGNQFYTWKEDNDICKSYKDIKSFFFSGIKVYPPLGFNPWPDENADKGIPFIKTNLLYQFCEERGIPMTTHCSDGGFRVIAEDQDLKTDKDIASPKNWECVLKNYEKLKVDFAHFGNQGTYAKKRWGEWTGIILDYICKYENVYTDLSDIGVEKGRYTDLLKKINEYLAEKDKCDPESFKEKLESRILFGTDFMMNLFHSKSNLEYLQIFDNTEAFQSNSKYEISLDKNKFCHDNPKRFLFS